ncbi:MAG: mechanosensitive ion channel [Rhodomicrobium sp.]|nr:mechanosensitive ion channel [Rhodomicrobium sp.]
MPAGLAWVSAPKHWFDALNTVAAKPLAIIFIAFFIGGLILLRPLLIRRLDGLGARVGKVGRDTYWTTPLALLLTLLLTAPVPVVLAGAAGLLSDGSPFANALSAAFVSSAVMLFVLIVFRDMARPNGLFSAHFSWTEDASAGLRKNLGWFAGVQAAAAFFFTLANESGDPVILYSIGLIAFAAGAVGIAVFAWLFFHPTRGVVSELANGRRGGAFIRILFPIAVLAPLVNGVISFRGYFDTALELQSRVFQSGLLLLVAAIVYGLLMRLFGVAQRRFRLEKARERRAQAERARELAEETQASGDATPLDLSTQEPDADEISDQIRTVFLVVAGVVLVFGLWGTWSPVIPALGVADDITLWRTTRIVDGASITDTVTLWDGLYSLALIIGGFVIARNIRGLLEIGLFQRMGLDAGARYAAVTIAGYVIVAVGMVAGFARLGTDWSKLQWIVAALGVGLGFGLQEIVANFVSGLIILFERPIRVGDTVTIGAVSGTVNKISIRATTLTDWDNRDVIFPNKTIITQNVTNWTLVNQVVRLLISVGVAYGSDINQVRNLIMKTVNAHPDVLKRPPATVFFMRHADSALEFEIRVFVAAPGKLLPVTHELNEAINKTLAANGIAIPFPQRDLHVHGLDSTPVGVEKISRKSADRAENT